MNKTEFIAQLKARLKKLPEIEEKNAINYYEEYFDEAGIENEQKVIEELESPANVASKIIADFAIKDVERSPKKGLSVIWTVLLAILASPIALPLTLVVVLLVFVLVLVILILVFALGVVGISFTLSGIISMIFGIFLLFQHFATALLLLGFALFFTGIGIVCLKGTLYLSNKSFSWLTNKMGQFLLRRSKK